LEHEIRRSQERTQQSYQQHPYRTHAWTSCQPARLETVARLFGLDAASADHCRVLELGCGDGGNLVPMGIAHPESTFVGVDLAPVHVEAGRELIADLDIRNVELHAASFVDFETGAGHFDYVIAHGLMSWITPELQELLFERIRGLLARTGVAFVSYNTHPGWSMQLAIRDMLRHHSAGVNDVDEVLERSRILLDTLIATVPGKEKAYRDHLESIGAVARNPDRRYYFVHEYLEDENHPFFVRDFVRRAEAHALGYLGDADLIDFEIDNMPVESSTPLRQLAPDRIGQVQTLDYAVNRRFRQSLLCHGSTPREDEPDLSRVEQMYVLSSLQPDAPPVDVAGAGTAAFSDRHGRTIEVDQPLAKGALDHFVTHSPAMLSFDALVEKVGGSGVDAEDRRLLSAILGRLFLADMIELRASPPCWATRLPDRPRASALVRYCAERESNTTSLRHRTLALEEPAVREVLRMLDGSRTRSQLAAELADRLAPEEIDRILELAVRNGVLCP
jgi:methyltransferase-like protein/ubiquinone/menaquinone biosynthesis C-methylase UbiE